MFWKAKNRENKFCSKFRQECLHFLRLWLKPHGPEVCQHIRNFGDTFSSKHCSKNHTMRSNSTSMGSMWLQRTQASLDQNDREFHQNYWKFSLIRSKGPRMDLKHLQFLKITIKFPRAVNANQSSRVYNRISTISSLR